MYISISKTNIVTELTFTPIEVEFEKIPNITATKNYSPFIFKDNKRSGKNFLSAHCLFIDVDNGKNIEEAKKILKGYKSLILTSRSHAQKEKNGKTIEARDRFRVAICLKEPITDATNYKKIIKELIHIFGADKACSDLARYYYCNPNQEVFTIEGDEYWDVNQYIKEEAGKSQPPLASQKKAKGKGGKIKFEDTQIVKTISYGELNVDKLFETLKDGASETIHCCIHPENHANKDANPSCVVSRNKEFLNFKCFVCEDTAYFQKKKSEEEIPFVLIENKAPVQKGMVEIDDIVLEAINSLPPQNVSKKEHLVDIILRNIRENCTIPICSYSNTLHLYYEGKWYAIDNPEIEKFVLVKKMIERTMSKQNPPSHLICQILIELQTTYRPLDAYLNDEFVYINMRNAVVRIAKNGEIKALPHDASYGFKWILPYDYNPEAKCPQIVQFLNDIINDVDAIKVLQEFCGYIFLPHKFLNHEKALWLYGATGANGKSVFLSLVHLLIDEINISHLNISDLDDPIKRTMLSAKIVNITNDATVKNIDTGTYKALISGETTTIRKLYKGSAELKAIPKFIVSTNELPLFKQGTEAFMRRMILVPFNTFIPEGQRDIHLAEKLASEVEGLFIFAVEGLKRLIMQKQFSKSNLIDTAIADYASEIDVLDDFLQDNPIEAQHGKGTQYIEQSDLFTRLGDWCKTNYRKSHYSTPRQLRERLLSHKQHGFELYKNCSVYGIKGRWGSIKVANNAPNHQDSEYE